MTQHHHSQNYWRRRTASVSRWLHIYFSMVSFAIVFFFAVTGITLNHTEWFSGQERVAQLKGSIDTTWVKVEDAAVNKLSVVEHLRSAHGIKGALSDFRLDETQAAVSFKGPGYAADAFINRESGEYELTETRHGFVAVLNDLHKGRDTGRVWAWVIDLSAALMCFVSLTGMVLIWFVKRHRFNGLLFAALGGLLCYLLYQIWVP
ncbi:MAG: PepSY-associated TM helix domain-containing protein [Acidobacteriota bacterium]|nr:PepSY-associated TM helix domain-containing protein [Acidobacteriota bacterium]